MATCFHFFSFSAAATSRRRKGRTRKGRKRHSSGPRAFSLFLSSMGSEWRYLLSSLAELGIGGGGDGEEGAAAAAGVGGALGLAPAAAAVLPSSSPIDPSSSFDRPMLPRSSPPHLAHFFALGSFQGAELVREASLPSSESQGRSRERRREAELERRSKLARTGKKKTPQFRFRLSLRGGQTKTKNRPTDSHLPPPLPPEKKKNDKKTGPDHAPARALRAALAGQLL